MISLKQMVGTFLQPQEKAWQAYLIQNWATIMGSLHSRVRLEKIQGDTVVMGVYDSHWMHELFMLTPTLIATINRHLDEPHVRQVRLQLVRKKIQGLSGPAPKKRVAPRRAPVTTPRHERALKEVVDPQLKEILRRFLQQCTP